jgi:uncharacterized SAM-binding protein YcdF (DUF218 family)
MQDVAKFLINPLPYVWIGLLVLLFSPRRYRRNLLLILTIYFYVVSVPITVYIFNRAWSIEDTFVPDKSYDAVVVLSGVADPSWYITSDYNRPESRFRFNENINRLMAGIGFVESGKAPLLLLGGFKINSFNEATILREFAIQHGLRDDQIRIYGEVNRTIDEAKRLKEFTEENSIQNLLLVTSALHMRRSLAIFNKQGLTPNTYSVNRKDGQKIGWSHFIPSPGGAGATYNSLYELVGYMGYYVTGDL